MNWKNWLEKWDMTSLKVQTAFLEIEWQPQEKDKDAAWELYIELITRVATQQLIEEEGDELVALESVYRLFELTRTVIKANGRDCVEFTKIAIIILNQVVRPFTTKWHRISRKDGFKSQEECHMFREELEELQARLRIYTKMLAEMAGVEDISDIGA